MKQSIALLLCLVMILPFVSSCQDTTHETSAQTQETETNLEDQTTSTETNKTQETMNYPTVAEPLSWDKINAIPIANDSMTEDELRKICTDFFRLTLSFSWTPNAPVDYIITKKNRRVLLNTGMVYGGLPYVTGGAGNLYKMMNYYDPETGLMDIQTLGCGELFEDIMGSQCSFSSTWAWARVSNNVKNFRTTAQMTHANGCLIVGEYTYNKSLKDFSTSGESSTNGIIQANGEQVMFRSLACVKPADGLVTSTGSHVRMVSSLPNVVYKEDGTIDGDKSTLTYLDQPTDWKNKTQSNGDPIRVQGGVDVVITFKQLLDTNYIPFTIAEFCGQDPVEKSEISFNVTGDSATIEQLASGRITCNYVISNVVVTVKDRAGKELISYDPGVFTRNTTNYLLMGNAILPTEVIPFADGKNTIFIDCRVSTGELINIYTGTLLA